MPLNCARRALTNHLDTRLYAIGEQHPGRGELEAAQSQANKLGCLPACTGRSHCAIGLDDPILRILADRKPAGEPERNTIIIND